MLNRRNDFSITTYEFEVDVREVDSLADAVVAGRRVDEHRIFRELIGCIALEDGVKRLVRVFRREKMSVVVDADIADHRRRLIEGEISVVYPAVIKVQFEHLGPSLLYDAPVTGIVFEIVEDLAPDIRSGADVADPGERGRLGAARLVDLFPYARAPADLFRIRIVDGYVVPVDVVAAEREHRVAVARPVKQIGIDLERAREFVKVKSVLARADVRNISEIVVPHHAVSSVADPVGRVADRRRHKAD